MAGFEIVAETLEGHGKQLDDLGSRIQTAVQAAQSVSMPTDAYGIICQPFRMMLDPVEQWGLEALQGAVAAMEAAGKAVRDTVTQYREIEDSVRDSFRTGS
ncbi:type VII secretion target [Saccharothrix australiensis]|uniref:Excreted virulence factor EspC (Type VII ESX diderm) n=1 Tax=Saccharothrix australiensis TaxID=2072 RepID=A0A495W369_9PSEU|nr:excreted virulence factor EspC (type VII ESX diderm) [Saccharothrix australiensis]